MEPSPASPYPSKTTDASRDRAVERVSRDRAPALPEKKLASKTESPQASVSASTSRQGSDPASLNTIPQGNVSVVEQEGIDETNRQRRAAGCAPLVVNQSLQEAARDKATEMVQKKYFAHDSPSGESPAERARRFGYTGPLVGENILVGVGADGQAAVDAWMNSDGHRRNILTCSYRYIGIGYDPGRVLSGYSAGSWAQIFGG
ncbi:MAG: CAP domain-containing protein [Actinomycetota bacterium]